MSAGASTAPNPAEQELREFSYIVSHDLAQSIRHLSQFSSLLLRDLNVGRDDPRRRYIDHLDAATAKCHQMLEQLLVYSRMQQAELTPAPIGINRLIDEAALRLSGRIEDAELAISNLGTVVADRALLSEAIFQILDNALKFRAADRPCVVRIDAQERGGVWALRVADNGIGVPIEQGDYAFRMFSRLNAEELYPGVGAGLAIARRIARRHGGELCFVDGSPGACLELTLPNG